MEIFCEQLSCLDTIRVGGDGDAGTWTVARPNLADDGLSVDVQYCRYCRYCGIAAFRLPIPVDLLPEVCVFCCICAIFIAFYTHIHIL